MTHAVERCLTSTCGSAKSLGSTHPATLDEQEDLAHTLAAQGLLSRAEEVLRGVWGGRLKALGPSHPLTSRALRELAEVLRRQGRREEADVLLRGHRVHGLNTRHKRPPLSVHKVTTEIEDEALPPGMEVQTFGGVHTLKDAALATGHASNAARDGDKSVALLHRALAARRKAWGDHHPKTRAAHQHLRCLHEKCGDLDMESTMHGLSPAGGCVTLRLPDVGQPLLRRTRAHSLGAIQTGLHG